MRILVIHQFFLGEGDSGGSRWNQFAKYWVARGHQVTVLAGNLRYNVAERYPGCKGKLWVAREEQPGVEVLRCHVSRFYHSGTIGRAWAWMTFLFSAVLAAILRAPRPDAIVATSPPLIVTVIMWLLKLFYRVPAIFEVRDLWPDCIIDMGLLKNRSAQKLFLGMEWLGNHRSDWVNVLTPAFVTWLIEKKGVAPGKISMIPNGADLDLMAPGPRDNAVRKDLGLEGKFVVSYFGAHSWANRLSQLLETAALIKVDMPEVRILLVGDGTEKAELMERAKREELDNVIFVGSVPKEKVGEYIAASDACTAVLQDGPHGPTVYPNKVFDYMCCARPVIIGILGVARKLVEDAGAGVFAYPERPEAFKDAIEHLRADPERAEQMGAAGRACVLADFDRKMLADKYLEILDALVTKGRRAEPKFTQE